MQRSAHIIVDIKEIGYFDISEAFSPIFLYSA